jgi:hypothetical protein
MKKPPSLAPLEVDRKMETTRRKARSRHERQVPHGTTRGQPKELVRSSRPPSPDFEFFHDELSLDSARVRRELGSRGLAYLAHAVDERTLTPARRRFSEVAGSGRRTPFLIDHGTGVKLEGRSAILNYLVKHYPTSREREQARARDGLSGPEAWLSGTRFAAERANRLLREQAQDIRQRLGLPIRDARVLARQWRKTIDATTASARNALVALGEIAGSLQREWKSTTAAEEKVSPAGRRKRAA